MKRKYDDEKIKKLEKEGKQINWSNVLIYDNLTETYIEELKDRYGDEIKWDLISECQILSENFIEEHKDLLNWELISENQKLSAAFKKRNRLG